MLFAFKKYLIYSLIDNNNLFLNVNKRGLNIFQN